MTFKFLSSDNWILTFDRPLSDDLFQNLLLYFDTSHIDGFSLDPFCVFWDYSDSPLFSHGEIENRLSAFNIEDELCVNLHSYSSFNPFPFRPYSLEAECFDFGVNDSSPDFDLHEGYVCDPFSTLYHFVDGHVVFDEEDMS